MGLIRRRNGRHGRPTSANGASSMHLWWDAHLDEPVVAAAVTLTVLEPPAWRDLCFWALQASFTNSTRSYGAAHLGLQWYAPHPGSTAVNFGGYRDGGGELAGSASALSSATGNPNTRDFVWVPHRPYRLSIRPGEGVDRWSGWVDDVEVRSLSCPGDRLAAFVVWTECFAPCDAEPSTVRWSDPELTGASGATVRPSTYRATYQSVADGGCASGLSEPSHGGGVQQRTGVLSTARPRTLSA